MDSRLGANLATRKLAANGEVWKPRITNTNGENKIVDSDSTFWRGYGPEGDVLLSEKYRINMRCTTNFKFFPFDSQVCSFRFGSCKFNDYVIDIIQSKYTSLF